MEAHPKSNSLVWRIFPRVKINETCKSNGGLIYFRSLPRSTLGRHAWNHASMRKVMRPPVVSQFTLCSTEICRNTCSFLKQNDLSVHQFLTSIKSTPTMNTKPAEQILEEKMRIQLLRLFIRVVYFICIQVKQYKIFSCL